MGLIGIPIALVASGIFALMLSEEFAPLAGLPWWSAIVLFVAGPLLLRARNRKLQMLALLTPLIVEMGFLFLTDFGALLRELLAASMIPGWFGLADLALLAPLIVAHFSICKQPYEKQSIFAATNIRARFAMFAWGATAIYFTLSSAASWWRLPRVWLEESSMAALGFSLVTLLAMGTLIPRLLVALLSTQPMGEPFDSTTGLVARHLGVRPPRLLEWDTGGEMSNALVLSSIGGPRPVLFTGAFLRQLSLLEFRAVVAHELGHVAGRHVGTMIAFMLGAAFLMDAAMASSFGHDLGEVFAAASAVVFLVLMLSAIGFISRRLELEADLYVFESTGEIQGLQVALTRATGGRLHKKGWRHFSVVRRLIFLRAVVHDRGVGLRLRRIVRAIKFASFGVFTAGLLGTVVAWLPKMGAEHFWVDVRSLHLDSAQLRLESLNETQLGLSEDFDMDDLRRTVDLGIELQRGGEALTTENLGQRALFVIDSDPKRAHALLELTRIIRDPESAPLREGLDSKSDLPPSWKQVAEKLKRSL